MILTQSPHTFRHVGLNLRGLEFTSFERHAVGRVIRDDLPRRVVDSSTSLTGYGVELHLHARTEGCSGLHLCNKVSRAFVHGENCFHVSLRANIVAREKSYTFFGLQGSNEFKPCSLVDSFEDVIDRIFRQIHPCQRDLLGEVRRVLRKGRTDGSEHEGDGNEELVHESLLCGSMSMAMRQFCIYYTRF
jgi:hypothetical protein